MKRLLPLLLLSALHGFAQQPPTPAPPATPAVPAPPQAPPPVNLDDPAPFKSVLERDSYAVGHTLGTGARNTAESVDRPKPQADAVIAGINDVLNGTKSLDYAAGVQIAEQVKRSGLELDSEAIIAAVRDVLDGKPDKLNPQQIQGVMRKVHQKLMEKSDARAKAAAAANLNAANEFLAANAKAEGVKSTPSGLQYKIEQPGNGKPVIAGEMLMLKMRGTTASGAEFEKSLPDRPLRRTWAAISKGLQEGLPMLKAGGKATFWVPPALGFGDSGRPPHIKPNNVLIYDVEVISSEPSQPAALQPGREPVTAVTPPITVEIPPKEAPPVPPKPVAPKPDAPKPDAPKPEAPKPDAPKAPEPK